MKRVVFASQLSVMVLWSAMAVASKGPVIDIPERARGAQRIVVASVATVTPRWERNPYGDELIVSHVALRVEETIKGTPDSALLLDLEGGTLGGVTLEVSSLPKMRPGERAVFFLDTAGRGSHVPHLKGLGILRLDSKNEVPGSSLRLDDIRRMSQGAVR